MDFKKSTLLSFRNGHKKPVSHNGFQLWQRSAASKKQRMVEEKYNLGYSIITKRWSSKPIKVKKDKTHYFEMIDRTVEVIKNKIQLPLPKLPENLPKNIAPNERPNKKIVIETQKSRFSK